MGVRSRQLTARRGTVDRALRGRPGGGEATAGRGRPGPEADRRAGRGCGRRGSRVAAQVRSIEARAQLQGPDGGIDVLRVLGLLTILALAGCKSIPKVEVVEIPGPTR